MLDEVVVEDSDGRLWTVQDGKCTCGHSGCAHARLTDKFKTKDRNLWFCCVSALHKELRIGDAGRAVAFGRLLEAFEDGSVRQYLTRILFEETRNLELVRLFTRRPPVRWEDLVDMFCASRKHWELSVDVGCMSEWWLLTGRIPTLRVNVEDFRRAVKSEGWREAYSMMMSVTYEGLDNEWTKDAKAVAMMEVLADVGTTRFPQWEPEIRWMAQHAHQNDEPTTLFAVAAGMWSEEANHFDAPNRTELACQLPWFRDYVYDCHTREGKDRIEKAGDSMGWGKPMPRGLDLRLSGSNAGCMWRKIAFPKFGNIIVPWENVIPPEPMMAAYMGAFRAVG